LRSSVESWLARPFPREQSVSLGTRLTSRFSRRGPRGRTDNGSRRVAAQRLSASVRAHRTKWLQLRR
jgi:hypothetical protein